MTTIYFSHTGPMIRHGDGLLHVADLNPEIETKWRMGRWALVKMAVRCLIAAIR